MMLVCTRRQELCLMQGYNGTNGLNGINGTTGEGTQTTLHA